MLQGFSRAIFQSATLWNVKSLLEIQPNHFFVYLCLSINPYLYVRVQCTSISQPILWDLPPKIRWAEARLYQHTYHGPNVFIWIVSKLHGYSSAAMAHLSLFVDRCCHCHLNKKYGSKIVYIYGILIFFPFGSVCIHTTVTLPEFRGVYQHLSTNELRCCCTVNTGW